MEVKVCIHSFLFYKNVVFPAQAEYSYFSADFRLITFLYYSKIISYDISVLEFIGVLSLKTQQRVSVFGTCFDVSNIIISHYEYTVKMYKIVGIYH